MVSASDIERSLRERYRQPAGVEQFGIEPVPEERKTVGWFDLFSIMFNFLINPGTLLSGGLAVAAGLPFWGSVAAGFFGTVAVMVFYVTMATIGVDYGIPGQVATRAVYGLRGAGAIPSLLRVVASIFWFAFQTFAGASAIVEILAKVTGSTYPLVWVSVIFGLIQACVAVLGYGSLKVLSRVALPIKIVVLIYLFILFAHHDDPNFETAKVLSYAGAGNWTWVLLAGWLNVTISAWFTNIADAADFARYTRSRMDMWVGTFAAGALGALLSTALGAYGAAATLGKVPNPFVLAAEVETGWLGLLVLVIFLCVDSWTINVLNLYSGGLSISNMFERLGRFWTTLIASVLGVALSSLPDVLNGYFHWANLLGNVFAPVAGVLVFDYLFVRRMRIDVAALFDPKGRYRYWHGFNLVAVAWTVIGVMIYSYVIPAAWIPALLTSLITGAGYAVTMALGPDRFRAVADQQNKMQ
jgi:nucleobase:cation symporter-1, NCS1 family